MAEILRWEAGGRTLAMHDPLRHISKMLQVFRINFAIPCSYHCCIYLPLPHEWCDDKRSHHHGRAVHCLYHHLGPSVVSAHRLAHLLWISQQVLPSAVQRQHGLLFLTFICHSFPRIVVIMKLKCLPSWDPAHRYVSTVPWKMAWPQTQ